MSDIAMLPPVLFSMPPPKKIAPPVEPDTSDEEGEGWEQELQDSPRSPALKAAILALVAALATAASRVPDNVDVPDGMAPSYTAEAALASLRIAISTYQDEAAAALDKHLPRVAVSLTKYVTDSTGALRPLSTDKVEADLLGKIQGFLAGDAVDLHKAGQVAVTNWHVAGGTAQDLRATLDQILADAEWQARRTAVTEVQNTYIDLFKAEVTRNGTEKVLRIVMPTACEEVCAPLAGVHYADDPELYDGHPNCLVGETLISGPPALASSDRWYDGDVVEIETLGGHVVAATPNHPVLTSQGFIAAGLLHEGGDVVCCTHRERMGSESPHNDQIPARIEDVARSLGSASGVPPVRVPVAAVDFHGDGVGSQVAVIRTDGKLRRQSYAALGQPLTQQPLIARDAQPAILPGEGSLLQVSSAPLHAAHGRLGLLDVAASLLGCQPRYSERLCFRKRAAQNTGLGQPTRNGVARHAEAERDGLLTLSASVTSRDFINRQQQRRLSRFALSLSIDAHPERITRVSHRAFSGHVYNLQTATGWYVANGIVTHNCMCAWEPADPSDEVDFSRTVRGPTHTFSVGNVRGAAYPLGGAA